MDINFSPAEIFWLSPLCALFLASIIPLTIKVFKGNKELKPFATLGYAFIGLLSAFILTMSFYSTDLNPVYIFNKALVIDGLSIVAAAITLIAAFFCLLFSREHIATCGEQFSEYTFLVLNSAIGMIILSWSNDLIVTFIGIELMSLCLYLLIALSKEQKLSKEAALKYFVLGSFASAIFLYGLAFIFGTTGTTYLHELVDIASKVISINRLFLVGISLLVIGFCFKVALVPFHAWTPDVYQGAPTPITAFMATGVKVITFVAFLRLIATNFLVGERADLLVAALQWLAAFTIIAGNVGAIIQNNLKRMLAYSSVAHSGYIMVGLIAAGIGGQSVLGASGLIFYAIAYTIMTIGTFAIVNLLEKNENSIVLTSDLKGLYRSNPGLCLAFTLLLLSLAGIPPTIGFFGKFYLFSAAIKQGMLWLSVWGVIGSVISVYYYLRPIVYMYMEDSDSLATVHVKPFSQWTAVAMGVLVVVTGLFSSPVYTAVKAFVGSLF